MAGGLNDLELETETLEEINLSPQPAARPPPAVPARRARRIVSGVALGVTLVLALITWVSLRVDTPPKARAAPDLVSTPPAAADVPEVVTPVAVCPVPLTVRGTQALVSFAPLAFKLFCAARQNAVLRRSHFPPA